MHSHNMQIWILICQSLQYFERSDLAGIVRREANRHVFELQRTSIDPDQRCSNVSTRQESMCNVEETFDIHLLDYQIRLHWNH